MVVKSEFKINDRILITAGRLKNNTYANFLLVKLLDNITSSNLKAGLEKQGILIRDASNFKFLNDEFIRIAVKNRKSNKRLIAQLSGMK